ncbi:tumor protein p53-inducible protein 11-like isoform X2 [Chiloscyllium punctatum]|uniref:tumor protein p53-inducible protein 11-like isoform X2 n=1 Tax=Chiloscyllium punctatum TaxID=137246 RepID=UPI003B631E69
MAAKPQPPLVKKHSQTDLVSRLKTRKILGVGGKDDDGEIHRSKISQVLGNEMKFTMREPLGLRIWQVVSAIMFSVVGVTALIFPKRLYETVFDEDGSSTIMAVRLYGGALLITSALLIEKGALPQGASLLQFSRALFILISIYFYYQVGRKPRKM